MNSQEANSPSTARVKVDFVQPIKDNESNWNHRKSLAWDTAFFTNSGVLEAEELFGSLKIGDNEIEVDHKHSSNNTLPCVSSQISNRPSFAWDNAFFTDPGVLDAEELFLVNNGFTTNTQLRKPADSMMNTTQGNRFSVSTIEYDLFHDLRASLRNSSPSVKQTVTREIHPNLPNGKKRTKGYKKKEQPLSLIPQPKVFSSSSFVSKSKPAKKCVASDLGRNKGKHKNHVFEEQSGSKSILKTSNSRYGVKDLTSSSSGLKLPRPKMGFFDSENGEKKTREPNTRRTHKSTLATSCPLADRSERKTRK